jgi:hypothetical protein
MWQHILATPLGNRSSPAMAHYGMEIYNNNIMPSIYTNSEVRYTNYLPVGNSFDPSCGNYFGRVEQEKFPLNSSVAFSQPVAMHQVTSMDNLYGRSNLDGSANYFGYSFATQVARTEVTPISYSILCIVASGFHLAQYAANHYSQINDCASTSQNFYTDLRSLPESYSCQSSTPYMLPTISYYNSVSDLHMHESMEGQLDRTSNNDFPSSNAGIDLVLEKQRESIVGFVIEVVFVLPSEFQVESTSGQAKGENERPITIDGFILVKSSNLADLEERCNTMIHADAEFLGDLTNDQVQSAINEGRLEFAENPQMKLDKDPLQVDMNMVELEGKKVLVWPSQADSTEDKKVVIGDERQTRMIRPKNPEIGRWKKNERSKPQSHPKVTFDILIAKYEDGKARIRGHKNRTIRFP